MASLTFSGTLTYGDTTAEGAVASREPLTFTVSYTEASMKTVAIEASQIDSPITLDSVGSPKFLLVQSLETDVDIKVSDGIVATPTPTKLSATSGWVLVANPGGQPISSLLVTTPATPSTGARIRVVAVE